MYTHSRNQFNVIPRRAFSSPAQKEASRGLLRRALPTGR